MPRLFPLFTKVYITLEMSKLIQYLGLCVEKILDMIWSIALATLVGCMSCFQMSILVPFRGEEGLHHIFNY